MLVQLNLRKSSLIVVVAAVVNRPAKLQRLVEQVRLAKGQGFVTLILADRKLQRQRFALAKQIVRRVVEADESPRQPADSTRETNAVLPLLMYLQCDIDRGVLGVLLDFLILVRFEGLEILQLIQPK